MFQAGQISYITIYDLNGKMIFIMVTLIVVSNTMEPAIILVDLSVKMISDRFV